MSKNVQDAWFYSRNGEKYGPVSLAELKRMAAEAGINPRYDLVWTQGMAEWKAAGDVQGLFEKRPQETAREALAPPADPFQSPKFEAMNTDASRLTDWPGARRRVYLFVTILLPILLSIPVSLFSAFFAEKLGAQGLVAVSAGLNILIVVLTIYYSIARFPNLGMSRWWYLGYFVPFLNFWVGYRSFACPAGYAYHKKMDGVGILLAIIYWLMILMLVLAVAAIVAVMMGAVGDPKMKQEILDAFSQAMKEAKGGLPAPKP